MFKFGPSKRYVSKEMLEIPMLVKKMSGKEDVLKVFVYVVEVEVPFLCGKITLEGWKAKINTGEKELEIEVDGDRKRIKMVDTRGNHFAILLEKEEGNVEEIMYAEGKEEELNTFRAIRKVHEVTAHKSADQLINVYRNAGLMVPNTVKRIKEVLKECKVCQKFGKSMVKPRVALHGKAGSFNEIVTLDLKQFGAKYVLWCVDAFTRFVQGKIIGNKKAETIVNAVVECWNLPFGIPSVGYFADNGAEFKNVKMDELVSKLGINIKYGPAYILWSNGINERNHASCDIIIKKLMEDKKIGLTDILVKMTA